MKKLENDSLEIGKLGQTGRECWAFSTSGQEDIGPNADWFLAKLTLVMIREHSVCPPLFIKMEDVSFFHPICPKSHLFSHPQEPSPCNTSHKHV